MKIFCGSDHAGFELKNHLMDLLKNERGLEVIDKGTYSKESCDYPDFAQAVGEAVAADSAAMGLLVCGSGIGISISANKIKGIRAALVSDPYAASLSRLHNNANIICLGARLTGPDMAWECVKAFLDTAFAGGRHEKRVAKISALENI